MAEANKLSKFRTYSHTFHSEHVSLHMRSHEAIGAAATCTSHYLLVCRRFQLQKCNENPSRRLCIPLRPPQTTLPRSTPQVPSFFSIELLPLGVLVPFSSCIPSLMSLVLARIAVLCQESLLWRLCMRLDASRPANILWSELLQGEAFWRSQGTASDDSVMTCNGKVEHQAISALKSAHAMSLRSLYGDSTVTLR